MVPFHGFIRLGFNSKGLRTRRHRRRVSAFVGAALLIVSGTESARAEESVATRADGTSAAATASRSPSGLAMPTADLPGWRQIFRDDFNTTVPMGSFPAAVSSKWGAYSAPGRDTSKLGAYRPDRTVSIAGGVLTKYIHTENGVPMVAGLVPKVTGSSPYGQKYGRYAIRFRTDRLPGYKMAWMLWPDSSNNQVDGEIDWPEMNLDGTAIWGFVHRTNQTNSDDQAWFKKPAVLSNWHTAVIEWKPNLVVVLLDGVEVGRTTKRIPKTAMHWVLQTETALHLTSKPSATVKGNVQIDWVAAWAYDTSIGAPDTVAPRVSLSSPGSSAVVKGSAQLSATATDSGGIKQTKWYVDNVEVARDAGGTPWSVAWDSRRVSNGKHRIFAKAADAAGNWGTSPSISITVSNP
jgi:Bacterial Ig domain/Glycosyl hydrolases family 16